MSLWCSLDCQNNTRKNCFTSHYSLAFTQGPAQVPFPPQACLLLQSSLLGSCLFSTHLNLDKIQAISDDENQSSTSSTLFLCIFSMCRAAFEVRRELHMWKRSQMIQNRMRAKPQTGSSDSHIQGQKYTLGRQDTVYLARSDQNMEYFAKF